MNLSFNKKIIAVLIIFTIIEALSFLGYLSGIINLSAFIILGLLALVLSLYKLEFGLLMLLGELFISSFGYFFYLNLEGYKLSFRIALWAIIMAVFIVKFLIQLIRQKRESRYLKAIKEFRLLKYFLILFIFIALGLLNGFFRGYNFNLIFADFNAWLYFLLLFPIITVYFPGDKKTIERLKIIFSASLIFISLKTLFLLFVFSHNLSFAPDIYLWLRRNLIGEMTATASGWPRIFLQAQIFPAIGFLILFWRRVIDFKIKEFFKKNNIGSIIIGALFLSTVLISFSRSFWVALLLALFISLILVWIFYSFRKLPTLIFWLFSSALLSFVILYSVAVFPYPSPGAFKADFIGRISDGNEAAISSRWSQVPILIKEIIKEPFFGKGYGKTLTYLSSDPRVLKKNPSGEYSTYAFEWGYLDIILKIGLLGLVAYLFLFFKIIGPVLLRREKLDYLNLGLSFGLLFLALVSIFTPYLNHPLGIGFLLLSSCLISKDRVY